MKHRTVSTAWVRVLVSLVLGMLSPLAIAELPNYQVIDLGTLGGRWSVAYAINGTGQVAGHANTSTTGHAFLYSNGSMQDLGTFGGSLSYADGINEDGVVVGWAYVANDAYGRAFRYSNGVMSDLGTLGGTVSDANDINDRGQIVGWSELAPRSAYHAFLLDGTTMQDLGTLGGTRSEALGLSNTGLIVGRSYTADDAALHAFLVDSKGMHDLGTFGGDESVAYGVNDLGHVVGAAKLPTGEFRAFLCDGMAKKDLGTLGEQGSVAYSVNTSGHVVGDSTAGDTNNHGFIYDGKTMRSLNSLIDPASGWAIFSARAINDLGQIAATGCYQSRDCRAVRLDPILTGVWLAKVELSKPVVAGCLGVTGRVTLSSAAPVGGLIVTLYDTLTAVTVPASITIPAGATTKSFAIKTLPVSIAQDGRVSASLNGRTLSQKLTVRPIGVSSLALSNITNTSLTPSTSSTPIDSLYAGADVLGDINDSMIDSAAVGSNEVIATAALECKAAPGPITVELISSNPSLANPVAPNVVVPQGVQKSEPIKVTTQPVLAKTSVKITATANGIAKITTLTLNPAATVSPTSLKFGSVPVGQTSAPLNATLTNKGAVPFSVSSITLTGTYASWFAQTNNCGASLAAGSSCTIGVTFRPQAVASKSAKLRIATSATSTPLSVSLSGAGT